MNIPSANTFDPTNDLYEIGLMAAASPENVDELIRTLLASGTNSEALDDSGLRSGL
jgi:hypothetical protein